MHPDHDGCVGLEVPLRMVATVRPKVNGFTDIGPPEAGDVEGRLSWCRAFWRRGLDDTDAGILHGDLKLPLNLDG
jgi:hypothetical protein